MIRKLPKQDKRVETGVIQFGKDWPGVFIRGDNAFMFASALKQLADKSIRVNCLEANVMDRLIELLESCRQTGVLGDMQGK